MSEIEYFAQECGPALHCVRPSDKVVHHYRNKLPSPLREHWQERGWCGYADGLLWVVNPQDFEGAVQDWVERQYQPAYVFARTAFGDMFVWAANQVYFLSVHHGWFEAITDDIEIFFNTVLSNKEYLDIGLRGKLFREALPRLGAPEPDECYAFMPALPLGGSEDAGTLQRVKLREHLAFLAQLQ